jgi:NADH-quinone oxidoreductase subunit G
MAPRTEDEREVFAAIGGAITATYEDVEHAPVIVIAGLDPEEEVPILHLRLRKAWRKQRARILVVGPTLGSLDEIAWRWVQTAPADEADALVRLPDLVPEVGEAGESAVILAGERLARSAGALPAAANLAARLGAKFAWVPRRNNARGAVDAGLVPGLLPGGRLGERDGLDTRGMLEGAVRGDVKVLHLIGVDPVKDFEDPELARRALEAADTVIVQDLLPTASTEYADIILPAAAPQERVGSFTTWEGRRQPFPQAVPLAGLAMTDWDILRQIARTMGTDLGWETANDVRREAAPEMQAQEHGLDRIPDLEPGEPPRPDPEWPFTVVVLRPLIGSGDMLRGAKELLATARPRVVAISTGDAERLGVSDGQHVAVIGMNGRLELPVKVTSTVVDDCVVLPEDVGSPKVRLERVGGGVGAAGGPGSEEVS